MDRLRRGGKLRLGVNYRLHYGYDFGVDSMSLREPSRMAAAKSDFARIASHGARVIRWFVLNDGRLQHDGVPISEIAATLKLGLDAALEHGLAVVPVLVDHTICFAEEAAGPGRRKQGFGEAIKDNDRFERLLGEWLEPLISVAATHPAVIGIELMNEPEMAMQRRDWLIGPATGAGSPKVPRREQLTVGEMRERMTRCKTVIGQYSRTAFSIGSMSSRWAGQWERVLDPVLDFLTVHYYGGDDERDLKVALESRLAPLAGRIAFGFGEFYPNGARCIAPGRASTPWPDYTLSDFLDAARRYGFQIAMPWVYRPGSEDPGEIPFDEWDRWRARHE